MPAPLEALVFLPSAPQSRGFELGELSPAPRTNGRSHLLRKRTELVDQSGYIYISGMYAAPAHLTCSWIDSMLQMIKLDAV